MQTCKNKCHICGIVGRGNRTRLNSQKYIYMKVDAECCILLRGGFQQQPQFKQATCTYTTDVIQCGMHVHVRHMIRFSLLTTSSVETSDRPGVISNQLCYTSPSSGIGPGYVYVSLTERPETLICLKVTFSCTKSGNQIGT